MAEVVVQAAVVLQYCLWSQCNRNTVIWRSHGK